MSDGLHLQGAPRAALMIYASVMALVLLLPTALVIPMSFSDSSLIAFPPHHWSLRWWRMLPLSTGWIHAIRLSTLLATATVALAVPIAGAAAYAANMVGARLRMSLQAVLLAPLVVPPILAATSLFFLYSRLLINGTFLGLLLGHTLLAVPVAYLVLRPAVRTFDFAQEWAAMSLGATRMQAVWWVVIPQLRRSAVTAALFAFLTSLDEVVIALFVGSGTNTTVTKVMFESLRDRVEPMTAVISTIWTLLVVTILASVGLMTRRRQTAGAVAPRSRYSR
jgi:putative spermidine/putrescine transport system permease protein